MSTQAARIRTGYNVVVMLLIRLHVFYGHGPTRDPWLVGTGLAIFIIGLTLTLRARMYLAATGAPRCPARPIDLRTPCQTDEPPEIYDLCSQDQGSSPTTPSSQYRYAVAGMLEEF